MLLEISPEGIVEDRGNKLLSEKVLLNYFGVIVSSVNEQL